MSTNERDRDVFVAYMLATRIIDAAHDLEFSIDEAQKGWDLLRDVAAGAVTVITTPVELERVFPTMDPALREMYREGANRLVSTDREMASAIIRGYDRYIAELAGRHLGEP